MTRVHSIRTGLMFGVIGTSAIILILGGALLYEAVRRDFISQADLVLHENAALLQRQVEFERGEVKLEHDGRFAVIPDDDGFRMFQIWTADGKIVATSPGLGDVGLPRFTAAPDAPIAWSLTMPDGKKVRAIATTFSPLIGGNDPRDLPAIPGGLQQIHLVLANDLSGAEAALGRLLIRLCVVGIGTFLMLGLSIQFVVGRALRPLRRISKELELREEDGLDSDLVGGDAVPRELQPLVSSFNGLLARIRKTLVREKQFTSSAAHELRTPLAGLTSTLEQAIRRERSPDDYRETIAHSLESARDMNALVERLLSLSRLGNSLVETEISDVPMKILIDGALETFQGLADQRELTIDIDASPNLLVHTDPALMQLVVNNLVENALSYADAGSVVKISAHNGGPSVRLKVLNESSNISPDDAKRVFQPFWRADSARSAVGLHAGLGLAICQRIVELFHGKIHADSEEGGVFGVTVELPAQA